VSFALEIQGNLIVNGSVSAAKLNVINLSSVSANVGVLTAGRIQSSNGLMIFDLDNNYWLISQP
jgi:hypothetical protein